MLNAALPTTTRHETPRRSRHWSAPDGGMALTGRRGKRGGVSDRDETGTDGAVQRPASAGVFPRGEPEPSILHRLPRTRGGVSDSGNTSERLAPNIGGVSISSTTKYTWTSACPAIAGVDRSYSTRLRGGLRWPRACGGVSRTLTERRRLDERTNPNTHGADLAART